MGSKSHLGVEGKEELSSQEPGEAEDGKDQGSGGRGAPADAAVSIPASLSLHTCRSVLHD